jgi:hypothetical protein
MLQIVSISGYGRSGKTSVLTEFKRRGWLIYSASQRLDILICRELGLDPRGWKNTLAAKNPQYLPSFTKLTGYTDYVSPKLDFLAKHNINGDSQKFCQMFVQPSVEELAAFIQDSINEIGIARLGAEVGNERELDYLVTALSKIHSEVETFEFQLVSPFSEVRDDYRQPFGSEIINDRRLAVSDLVDLICSDLP